jgi:hypothetical protein
MSRVLICAGVVGLGTLLAGVRSAAPPPPESFLAQVPLVDRLYQEVDFPGFDDPKTLLIEALDFMTKEYRTTFKINERAFKYEMLLDVPKTPVAETTVVPPMKSRLHVVLERVLGRVDCPSGATWMLRPDHVEITTGQFLLLETKDRGIVNRWQEGEGGLVLPRPLAQADFRKKPLSEALEQLAERTGFNVVLDEAVAKEKGATPVTARLRNVPIDTAVLVLASQGSLGMAELDNVFYVTTEEKAASLAKRHALLRPPPRKEPKKAPAPGK